jgi:hypothetical protein
MGHGLRPYPATEWRTAASCLLSRSSTRWWALWWRDAVGWSAVSVLPRSAGACRGPPRSEHPP